MIATYHNHSTWSDGAAPLAALVEAARRQGIDEIGVSDHFVLHPSGRPPSWSMPPDRLGAYVDEVLALRSPSGPVVRLGLEVDWFPGAAERLRAALDGIAWDYLIGAVHEVEGFRIDTVPRAWERLTIDEQNEKHRRYWQFLRGLAESGLFDVVAHMDLSKKFGHRPTADLSAEIDAALDAIAAAGLVVELNTAGWHKPCDDAYPTLDLLRGCRARDIPVTLSADAHDPDHLLRDFDRGAVRLREAGYDRIARFAERTITFDPLR